LTKNDLRMFKYVSNYAIKLGVVIYVLWVRKTVTTLGIHMKVMITRGVLFLETMLIQ
jgi:hypothetical protein